MIYGSQLKCAFAVVKMRLTFSALGAWEGPGDGGWRGLAGSPLRSTADTLGGVRQDRGEESGRRGLEAGEERGEGPGDTMEWGRPDWPGQREGEELWGRSGERATVGRSGLPAGGLWTKTEKTLVIINVKTDYKCSYLVPEWVHANVLGALNIWREIWYQNNPSKATFMQTLGYREILFLKRDTG